MPSNMNIKLCTEKITTFYRLSSWNTAQTTFRNNTTGQTQEIWQT